MHRTIRFVPLALLVLASCGTEKTTGTTSAPPASSAGNVTTVAAAPAGYKVGDTAKTSDLEVTVHAVTDPFASSTVIKPKAGMRWVLADVAVKNTSDKKVAFSTVLLVELVDGSGQSWRPTITGEKLPSLDGDVLAGGVRRGSMVFELPESSTGLQLRVKGSLTADGVLFTV